MVEAIDCNRTIELKNRFELDKLVNCNTNVFVQKVIDLILILYRTLCFP